MSFNVDEAVSYARQKALPGSEYSCARRVREAIECGGVEVRKTENAKDYGPLLEAAGFERAPMPPQRGDVVVIQPPQGNGTGHMAIFDGTRWISSSAQFSLYPDAAYRASNASYKVYRYPQTQQQQ